MPDAPDNRYEYIELISSLSPKDREIVTLKIALGLTHAEIAAILGISVLTMRCVAEDKRQKTDQLLYSLPLTMTQVILGKYGALLVMLLMIVRYRLNGVVASWALCIYIILLFLLLGSGHGAFLIGGLQLMIPGKIYRTHNQGHSHKGGAQTLDLQFHRMQTSFLYCSHGLPPKNKHGTDARFPLEMVTSMVTSRTLLYTGFCNL